jgi:hypothetical protein
MAHAPRAGALDLLNQFISFFATVAYLHFNVIGTKYGAD